MRKTTAGVPTAQVALTAWRGYAKEGVVAELEGWRTDSRRHRKQSRVLGLALGSSVLALVATALLLAVIPASATAKSKHAVHYGVYYESTTAKKSDSLDGVSNLLVLSTPSLPAGNYLATASTVDFTPEVLSSNNTAELTDYVDCYLAKLPNRTSTFDGNRSVGYGGYFTISVTDAFTKTPNGTRIGLYCYENERTQGADVDWASLEVTPYASMYAKRGG